ncbi:MAG TPA: DUF6062 family protein [Methylomirabilota bacterium]|nr:DUF6062 family protein [Methylomirabilota bacterium]
MSTLDAKFIGFFRLMDACDQPGCPVCRCLSADSKQYLETLLYEHVTDPDTRRRLRVSWGFCAQHARMLRETSNPAFGAAILCEDLLGVVIRRLERATGPAREGPRGVRRWLGRLGRPRRRVGPGGLTGPRARCPACRETTDAEDRYLRTALAFIGNPQFESAYERSAGLCVPHLVGLLERGAGTPQAAEVVARTVPKWRALRRDLADFVGKHDYRNRTPFTDAEATAYLRALDILSGGPGGIGA